MGKLEDWAGTGARDRDRRSEGAGRGPGQTPKTVLRRSGEPGHFCFGLSSFIEIVLASHLMTLRQSSGVLACIPALFLRAFLSYRHLWESSGAVFWCHDG